MDYHFLVIVDSFIIDKSIAAIILVIGHAQELVILLDICGLKII